MNREDIMENRNSNMTRNVLLFGIFTLLLLILLVILRIDKKLEKQFEIKESTYYKVTI